MASTIPFASKKSDGTVSGAPVRCNAAAGQRRGDAARLARSRHSGSELEEPHIGAFAVPIVRD